MKVHVKNAMKRRKERQDFAPLILLCDLCVNLCFIIFSLTKQPKLVIRNS